MRREKTPVDALYEAIMDAIRFAAPRDAVVALDRAAAATREARDKYERMLGG